MNDWYYLQEGQATGPFTREVLEKLRTAGLIDDTTPVRGSEAEPWRSFSELVSHGASQNAGNAAPDGDIRHYYLDQNRKPVGPYDVDTLRRLRADGVIKSATLVSGLGDTQWVPASSLFAPESQPRSLQPADTGSADQHPRYRSFEQFALMIGVTLSLYTFYIIPSQSRDMKAITGRERMEFTALLVLGIVTFGLLLAVMMVLWAYDLERHGKVIGKTGRQESLGTIVLVLNILSLVLGFAISDFIVSFVIVGILNASAVWFLQKEINLYATPPEATAS